MPTGMATRDNEIERHRNFSESIFGSGCLRIPSYMNEVHVMGYDRGAVWDEAVPVYVTRFGDKREPGICHKSKECGSNKNEAGGVYRTV